MVAVISTIDAGDDINLQWCLFCGPKVMRINAGGIQS
jgi:hypothetical protein